MGFILERIGEGKDRKYAAKKENEVARRYLKSIERKDEAKLHEIREI
jgi:hypothetical protein